MTFEFCECVDAKTGEELRHPKGECLVPGLVVVKIIYTQEEARRRKEEDKEVFEVFKKTDKQVGTLQILRKSNCCSNTCRLLLQPCGC